MGGRRDRFYGEERFGRVNGDIGERVNLILCNQHVDMGNKGAVSVGTNNVMGVQQC